MMAFCRICRTMREVMDEYLTDDGEPGTEWFARPMECGHDAGDDGGVAYQPRPVDRRREQALVQQVVDLQAGLTPPPPDPAADETGETA